MPEAPLCQVSGKPMARDIRPLMIAFRVRERTVALPGWYCDASGESSHSREDLAVWDRALASLEAEAADPAR